MKVFSENSSSVAFVCENKQMNIRKTELSLKLSKVIQFPDSIILLCRLPYINYIIYDETKNRLTYLFRNADITYNRSGNSYAVDYEEETLSELSEGVRKIFNEYL